MNFIFTTNFDILYLFLHLKYMMNPRKQLDQMFFPIFERDFFRLKYIFLIIEVFYNKSPRKKFLQICNLIIIAVVGSSSLYL